MDIKKEIFEHFKDKVDEEVLDSIVDDLIREQLLHDCMYFTKWSYKENIFRNIEIKVKYMKQKNEKKLVVARCFYSICNDKYILEKISGIE